MRRTHLRRLRGSNRRYPNYLPAFLYLKFAMNYKNKSNYCLYAKYLGIMRHFNKITK